MADAASALTMQPMQSGDLDEVLAIEQTVYSHPWSHANFIDALNNNNPAWVVRAGDGEILGYYVQMAVVDESHLLTLAVKGSMQRQGLGKLLLAHLLQQAKLMGMVSVMLEVRVSNQAALKLYEAFGFTAIGRRKNYYQINQQQREDALVLRYLIPV